MRLTDRSNSEAMPAWTRALDVLASTDPKRRLRLLQWLIASLVYAGSATVQVAGVQQGWISPTALAAWMAFIAVVLLVTYGLLRTGWSERFEDPSITLWQLSMGVVAVNWGYLICGPIRTSALLPIMVILAFGAFSLRWREIAFIALFAIVGLIAVVVARAALPSLSPANIDVDPLRVDIHNILMVIVVLPALATVAARLSDLRRRLRAQREALTGALADVERLAVSDELTGLPNRRSIMHSAAHAIALSDRRSATFAIALLDIDHFKSVNDELGHAAGDAVLRGFANAATARIRGTDRMGRWGGEEFMLVMPAANSGEIAAALDRIRESVRHDARHGRTITFSAGVALHVPGESLESLLARADEALYRAKRSGRDQHAFASDPASVAVTTRAGDGAGG